MSLPPSFHPVLLHNFKLLPNGPILLRNIHVCNLIIPLHQFLNIHIPLYQQCHASIILYTKPQPTLPQTLPHHLLHYLHYISNSHTFPKPNALTPATMICQTSITSDLHVPSPANVNKNFTDIISFSRSYLHCTFNLNVLPQRSVTCTSTKTIPSNLRTFHPHY